MNILNMLQVYAQKWQVKNQRGFTQEELAGISSAKVVASQYGNSVCLTLVGGGQSYIPLSQNSQLSVGEEVDLSKAQLLTLGRDGDADIYRVEC